MNSIEKLKSLRTGLLKLHRELITSERATYERSAGPIPSPGAFLQLLAHDPWFEWLAPFTQLIAKVDHAIGDKKQPITEERASSLIGEIRELLDSDNSANSFAKTYAEAMQRDPHLTAAHAEVRRELKD